MEWEERILADIFELKNGKAISAKEEGKFPIYGANGIIGFTDEARYQNAIIIGRVGAYCGAIERCKKSFWASDNTIVAICKESFDTNFGYYYLKNLDLNRFAGGAAQPLLTQNVLSKLKTRLPDLSSQKKIGEILSNYDELIENRQQKTKILEGSAHRLYNEWFVKMKFPRHEDFKVIDGVPEGWKMLLLCEAVEFDPTVKINKDNKIRHISMSALNQKLMTINADLIEVRNVSSSSKFENGDTLFARITPCLENGKTAFVNFLENGEKATGSTEFIVMRSLKINPYMVYCIARTEWFREIAIKSMVGATGRQRVQRVALEKIEFILPSQGIISKFGDLIEPIFNCINVLQKEIRLLRQCRDELLPKLMSGAIEV